MNVCLFVCLFGEGTHAHSVVAEASGMAQKTVNEERYEYEYTYMQKLKELGHKLTSLTPLHPILRLRLRLRLVTMRIRRRDSAQVDHEPLDCIALFAMS